MLSSFRLPIALFSILCLAVSASAAPSTSRGNISVAQVLEMIDNSASDAQARKVAMAYLFGVGEAVGFLFSEGAAQTGLPKCDREFSLDTDAVVRALNAAAPEEALRTETLATPIIVADMFARAGCR